MDLTPTPKVLGSPTFTGESPMGYLSPCRRGLLPLKKRRKLVAGAAARKGHADNSSSSGSNVVEPSPEFSSSKRCAGGAKMSSIGVLASAATAFASSSVVSTSSTSASDAAASSYTMQSDASSTAMSAPSIPVLQGVVMATSSYSSTQSSPTPTSRPRISYQDRRFTNSDPPEARCQATTTRGRACAFVSIAGTKYCTIHAKYDTAPPPRRSGFGGGGSNAPTSPRKGKGGDLVSLSATSHSEHKQIAVMHMPTPSNAHRPLLNALPSIQWSKKIVEIAIGPFAGAKGIVMKFGNGWVTVKVKGGDGKPGIMHNRRSMELYLLPENSKGGVSASKPLNRAGDTRSSGRPTIATPTRPGKGSTGKQHTTPLSPRSGREIHKPKRYDSSSSGGEDIY
mmetsp:Transcript_23771/g.68307  ORF Transcript_23771/g.68307 Transcript_23771/m.68307 type:complete len:395 (+) Transcript_23771:337-1521(+)